MRPPFLFLALALAAGAHAGAPRPMLEARVNVFQPGCSHAQREDVLAALKAGSSRLQAACGIRLRLGAWYGLPSDGPWCSLPADPQARSVRLKALAQTAKGPDPGALAAFLLPSDADRRYSWALVDQSSESACDSPQEPRFLDRFGSLFFTDLCFELGPGYDGTPRPGLLVLHEVLHALTQRSHPSGAARGSVMADHVADLGPALTPDWCACARRSPYVRAAAPHPPSGR